jgi:hypothetical protein
LLPAYFVSGKLTVRAAPGVIHDRMRMPVMARVQIIEVPVRGAPNMWATVYLEPRSSVYGVMRCAAANAFISRSGPSR